MSVIDSLAFDIEKQGAVLGWCLKAPDFFFKFTHVAKETWFLDPSHSAIFKAMMDLYSKAKKVPTPSDIQLWQGFKDLDGMNRLRIESSLKKAIEKADQVNLAVLQGDLDSWVMATIIVDSLTKANTSFNQKDVQTAFQRIEECVSRVKSSSFSAGIQQGFKPSEERIVEEEAQRMADAQNILPYGISVLDAPLGGIMPKDLIILGSETGSGKSSAVANIALANGQVGSNPYVFSLEAQENEIEMRIKYSLISREYYRGVWHQPISYRLWVQGKVDHLLKPIERMKETEFRNAVKGMKTLYRTSGDFTLENLDQKIQEIRHDAGLIIIDHLHYIDFDDKMEENQAYTRITKRIRDTVLDYSIPNITVAHLRKLQQGKSSTLVPHLADFHGTSNISKIATVCIMLARAEDQPSTAPGMSPTYIRIVKSRLDGSLVRYTNLIEYDTRTNLFQPNYRVGRLIDGGKEWEQITTNLPYWAEVVGDGEKY